MATFLGLIAALWVVMWVAVITHAAGQGYKTETLLHIGPVGEPHTPESVNLPHGFQPETQEFYYRVTSEGSFDFRGVQFFHLKSAEGSATISVDGDVKLAEALKALNGQRVKLTLEPATLVLKKVER